MWPPRISVFNSSSRAILQFLNTFLNAAKWRSCRHSAAFASAVCHSPLKSIYDKINTRTVLEFPRTPKSPRIAGSLDAGMPGCREPICLVFALLRCLFASCWRCHRILIPGPPELREVIQITLAQFTKPILYSLKITRHWQVLKWYVSVKAPLRKEILPNCPLCHILHSKAKENSLFFNSSSSC